MRVGSKGLAPARGREQRDLLHRIGLQVRSRRVELDLTIKDLAGQSGLSSRYLSDVEAGTGNISIGRLSGLAQALGLPLSTLVAKPSSGARWTIERLLDESSEQERGRILGLVETVLGRQARRILAILGVRGAGKSTVGRSLAERLDLPFVELVTKVENRAGMALADLFTIHDETYYRRLELECLTDLLAEGEPSVVAMPGGIVSNHNALELIRSTCRSIWLRARPEDYWSRVFAQGDRRPMAGREDAMADLRELVRRRESLYQQADFVVDTSDTSVERVVQRVLEELQTVSNLGPGPNQQK